MSLTIHPLLNNRRRAINGRPLNNGISTAILRMKVRFLLTLPVPPIRTLPFMVTNVRKTIVFLQIWCADVAFHRKLIRRTITCGICRSILQRPQYMFDGGVQVFFSGKCSIMIPLLQQLRATGPISNSGRFIAAGTTTVTIRTRMEKVTSTILPIRTMTNVLRRLLSISTLLRVFMNRFQRVWNIFILYSFCLIASHNMFRSKCIRSPPPQDYIQPRP